MFYGVFNDVLTPELPERIKPATPLILGVLLIVLMLVAPGGIVGLWRATVAEARGQAVARAGATATETSHRLATQFDADPTNQEDT